MTDLRCLLPFSFVNLPVGSTATLFPPRPPSHHGSPMNTFCGWIFTTVFGGGFTITCDRFRLRRRDRMYVTDMFSGYPLHVFRRKNPLRKLSIKDHRFVVAFGYITRKRWRRFRCYVTSTGSTSTTTTADSTTTPTPTTTTTTATPAPTTTTTTPSLTTTTTTTTVLTNVVTTKSCLCGVPNRSTRIVGGQNTEVNEYPWQVGMTSSESNGVFCGGAVISDRYIVTAAHCTENLDNVWLQMLLGGHSTSSAAPSENTVKRVRIITHNKYTVATSGYDIALIEFYPRLDFNSSNNMIRPICLPNSGDLYENVQATVSGWGTLSEGGHQPTILQEVTIPTMSNRQCANVYGNNITSTMLCAGTQQGGKDFCQEDSGGPLITPDGDNYELIGIASFGAGCAEPGVPGVYSRVTALQSWITANIAGSIICSRS